MHDFSLLVLAQRPHQREDGGVSVLGMTVSLHARFLCALFVSCLCFVCAFFALFFASRASIASRKFRRIRASTRARAHAQARAHTHTTHPHKYTHPHGRKALDVGGERPRRHLKRTQHTAASNYSTLQHATPHRKKERPTHCCTGTLSFFSKPVKPRGARTAVAHGGGALSENVA